MPCPSCRCNTGLSMYFCPPPPPGVELVLPPRLHWVLTGALRLRFCCPFLCIRSFLLPSRDGEMGSGRVSAVAAGTLFQPRRCGDGDGGSFLWTLPDLCERLVRFLEDADSSVSEPPEPSHSQASPHLVLSNLLKMSS